MNKKIKARITIAIFAVVVGLFSSLGFSTFVYRTLEKLPMDSKYFFPTNIIISIQNNQKHGLMFATMIFLCALSVVFIVINAKDKNQFASELDKITDKISTPKRVGQNQYGEAKWLEKKLCDVVYHKYVLKMEGEYNHLWLLGKNDINIVKGLEREVIKKINELPSDLTEQEKQEETFQLISEVIDKYVFDKQELERNKKAKKNNEEVVENSASDTAISASEQNAKKKEDIDGCLSDFMGKSFKRNGGLVVHYTKTKKQENIYCIKDDIHSIILGSTGSSKTRSVILQTICLLGLVGESIVINDPKGEIFQYTNLFLKRLGYEINVIDFRDRQLSQRYNFLQPVINAVNKCDVDMAVDLAWDITSSLVGEAKGEMIWHNGECCVIVSAILCVVVDNKESPQFQNLTNVYHFIANMCQANEKGAMPLDAYLKTLPDKHPAKGIMAQIKVAPSRTRGSFLTSALATLKLFTNPNTYNMTCDSDFSLWDVGQKKTALYMILPDEKTTFYPLASLFIYQLYVELADKSQKRGGRLSVRVNLMLDEFGNFAKIPAVENMLSVARGRGIRFNLVLQSYSQLNVKYDKELANVIKENCHCKVLLKTDGTETVKTISEDLGTYTTSSFSRSASASSSQSSSNSNSMNLISRPLLTPDQVKKVDRPHALVMYSGHDPFMATLPDLSKWSFNIALGLGDENHNTLLRMVRQKERKTNTFREIVLWNIWKKFAVNGEDKEEVNLKNHIDNLIYGGFGAENEDTGEVDDEGKTPEERSKEHEEKEKNKSEEKRNREKNMY